jgi:hypothetical protein
MNSLLLSTTPSTNFFRKHRSSTVEPGKSPDWGLTEKTGPGSWSDLLSSEHKIPNLRMDSILRVKSRSDPFHIEGKQKAGSFENNHRVENGSVSSFRPVRFIVDCESVKSYNQLKY